MEKLSIDNLPSDASALRSLLQQALLALDQKDFALHLAQHEIARLNELVKLFKRQKYGPSSEQYVGEPCLFNEPEVAVQDKAVITKIKSHERKRPKRRPLPANLPRVDHVYEVACVDRICECCSKPMIEIGEEVSEQLDIVPAKIQVLRHRRKKYGCPSCKEGIKTAKLPAQPLPKTNASPGLLAFAATAKYVDGLPLYRQEEIFRRLGIDMSRATLSRWMIDLAELLRPLYNSLREDLLSGPVVLMDETTVQVLSGTGKKPTANSFMWVQCRYGPKEKIVLFHYDPTRSASVAAKLLADFSGFLVTDGYKAYAAVARTKDELVHCGCWDHARRRFNDALKSLGDSQEPSLCAAGLTFIQNLYRVEARIKDLDKDRRKVVRNLYSRAILNHLRRWLDRVINTVPPKTLTGKALSYLDKEWPQLLRFLEDGQIPISNALAENAIRPFAIGRKNWLFCQSRHGAEASAVLYSLIETAKANGLEPHEYLKTVITALPAAKTTDDIERLLPYNSKS